MVSLLATYRQSAAPPAHSRAVAYRLRENFAEGAKMRVLASGVSTRQNEKSERAGER